MPLFRRNVGRPQFRYSRWDGTQIGFELDADEIMSEITDDLLYHGDLNAALRRMLQSGFDTPDGEHLQGLREIMEKLRQQRREMLEQHDLGGVYDEIADELREVVEQERESLRQMARDATESGDQRRQEVTDEVVQQRYDGPRPAPARPGRPGQVPAGVRVHLLRGTRALRGAHGPAPRAADAALRRPGVRRPWSP